MAVFGEEQIAHSITMELDLVVPEIVAEFSIAQLQ
jgi:hypothetical protein